MAKKKSIIKVQAIGDVRVSNRGKGISMTFKAKEIREVTEEQAELLLATNKFKEVK